MAGGKDERIELGTSLLDPFGEGGGFGRYGYQLQWLPADGTHSPLGFGSGIVKGPEVELRFGGRVRCVLFVGVSGESLLGWSKCMLIEENGVSRASSKVGSSSFEVGDVDVFK